MFGFGGLSEVLFILFLAMLIFGPSKMPEIARMLAKGIAEVRKASNELKRTLNAELAISEQEKEAARLQEASFPPPPPPAPPAWSGGQTVPQLDTEVAAAPAPPAGGSEQAGGSEPAGGSEAAASNEAPAAGSEAELSSDAAYYAAWPEDGSSSTPAGSASSPDPAAAAPVPAAPGVADPGLGDGRHPA